MIARKGGLFLPSVKNMNCRLAKWLVNVLCIKQIIVQGFHCPNEGFIILERLCCDANPEREQLPSEISKPKQKVNTECIWKGSGSAVGKITSYQWKWFVFILWSTVLKHFFPLIFFSFMGKTKNQQFSQTIVEQWEQEKKASACRQINPPQIQSYYGCT